MYLGNIVIFCILLWCNQAAGLQMLPQVDDNNILLTEAAIRTTINTLFFDLRLRDIRNKPRLKEYSIVHNHLVSFTLQDYNNLKEIAKLTRVDKRKINNQTHNFMTVLNELLNEDIDIEQLEFTEDPNDKSVIEYVENFLKRLETLREEYGVTNERYHINKEIYNILNDEDNIIPFNYTMDTNNNQLDFGENDTLLNESDYWKPGVITRRIYRGDRTKIKHFPFMASIQIFNKFHCGGCIIKSDLIITASSCLQLAWNNRFFRENPAFLSVRVGSNFYNGGGELVPVLEVYFHPEYNPRNLWNNICILRLVRRLNLKRKTRRVKKIEFDTHASNLPMTTDGITIVGWGARGASNIMRNPWENVLAFAVLDVYPLRECQEIYSKEYVTKKQFCAGFFSKGGGACNRDVGGPGIVGGVLTGIVSFGSPVCGTPDAPTVFTKVGYYSDWIENIMEQEVPHAVQRTTLRPTRDYFTLGQYFRPIQPTTFKIPPLSGPLKPIPVHEADMLRTHQNEKLFKEFLSTMFGDKDSADYGSMVNDIRVNEETKLTNIEEKIQEGSNSRLVSALPIQQITPFESIQRDFPVVTEMGYFDPADMHVPSSNEILRIDNDKIQRDSKETAKIVKEEQLEKDLVDLIDDIDLKEIINSMSSSEEDKLAEDDNVIKLFKEKVINDKIANADDILTLLYLSDSEKRTDGGVGNVKDYADREGGVDSDGKGMSIETNSFRDFTHRNSNNTLVDDILGKEELFDLVSEAIQNEVKQQG